MSRSKWGSRITSLLVALFSGLLLMACGDSSAVSLSLSQTITPVSSPVARVNPDAGEIVGSTSFTTGATPAVTANVTDTTTISYTFDADLPETDRVLIKKGILLAQKNFGPLEGFKILANHASTRLQPDDNVLAQATPGKIVVFVYSDVWRTSTEAQRVMTLVHEYYHMIQFKLSNRTRLKVFVSHDLMLDPLWLVEGSAEYLAYQTTAEAGLLSYQKARLKLVRYARTEPLPLKTLETSANNEDQVMDPYVMGTLGTEYLLKNFGGLAALTHYWELTRVSNWQDAFKQAFNLSTTEFYQKFEQFRKSDFPSDLPVGTLSSPKLTGTLKIDFLGAVDPGILTGPDPQWKPYLFTVSGVNLSYLSNDELKSALELPKQVSHWDYLGGNCLALYFTPEVPEGKYTFSMTLPDDRQTQTAFQYPATQKLKLGDS